MTCQLSVKRKKVQKVFLAKRKQSCYTVKVCRRDSPAILGNMTLEVFIDVKKSEQEGRPAG